MSSIDKSSHRDIVLFQLLHRYQEPVRKSSKSDRQLQSSVAQFGQSAPLRLSKFRRRIRAAFEIFFHSQRQDHQFGEIEPFVRIFGRNDTLDP